MQESDFVKISEGKNYDVIVCGSGSAGFCAALQAARAGMKTAVIEKYGTPGGTLTVLGNNVICQFNNPFRTKNKMIIQGIGWEFTQRLNKMGYASIPDMNADYKVHWQYSIYVNAVGAAKVIDDLFIEAGVDIYYNQPAVSVEVSRGSHGNRVESVIISTKSGLKRLKASCFIDCTGDGDICVWAGADFESGNESTGEMQPGTLRFYPGPGHLSQLDIEAANKILEKSFASSELSRDDLFVADISKIIKYKGDNLNHIGNFNAADSDSKTMAEIEGRRSLWRVMEVLRKNSIDLEILSGAPEIAARESRRIKCDGYITAEDYLNCRVYDDAVCYSFWFIDVHRTGGEGHIVYLENGKTPTIPMSAMLPRGLENVLVAGRCISGDRLANSAYRVKASCMAMGQAAGAAAAVAVRYNNGRTRGVNLAKVKNILAVNGAVVPGLTEPKKFCI